MLFNNFWVIRNPGLVLLNIWLKKRMIPGVNLSKMLIVLTGV